MSVSFWRFEMPINSLKHGIWILVADGARALLMRNDGSPLKPKFTLIRRYQQENPPTREQGTDRPGRTNDAVGHKSAMEETDWHQLAEDRFVREMADVLSTAYNRHEFDALVIAAPPTALGEMRKALPGQIRDHVVSEINKDLTHLEVRDLQEVIAKHIGS
jgi:protein required for attachment to host cells